MTVAITGATGFLGLRLLALLLRRGEPIVVLAHAGTVPATTRIMRHLLASGQPDEVSHAARTRMTVLNTDVGLPRLGLPEWQFRALAEQLTEIWHVAAQTTLDGPQVPVLRTHLDQPVDSPTALVRRVNVVGTDQVLALAAAGEAVVRHVSTAFVAGRRRTGIVLEEDLDASYGFENPYEESKFLAEQAVREWSARFDRPVTIFRPSVLVPDTPTRAGDARHTLAAITAIGDFIAAQDPPEKIGTGRLSIRVVGDPDAHLNLMPGDLAARLMVDMTARPSHNGVRTVHISYPHEVTLAALFELSEELYPAVRLEPVERLPASPTQLEALVAQQMSIVTAYSFHRRHYDRTALRAAGLDPTEATPLGMDYLRAGLRRPAAETTGGRP